MDKCPNWLSPPSMLTAWLSPSPPSTLRWDGLGHPPSRLLLSTLPVSHINVDLLQVPPKCPGPHPTVDSRFLCLNAYPTLFCQSSPLYPLCGRQVWGRSESIPQTVGNCRGRGQTMADYFPNIAAVMYPIKFALFIMQLTFLP